MNKIVIKLSVMLLGVILVTQTVNAQKNFAAPELLQSTSSAACGMGSAYTAISEDASATYWNPAGLAQVSKLTLTGLSGVGMSLDRKISAMAVAYPIEGTGTVGISAVLAGVNDCDQITQDKVKIGSFNTGFSAFGISYGISPITNFSFGATLKYLSRDLSTQKDNGVAIDLGAKYSTKQMKAGLVLQNVKGKSGADQLPMIMRVGVGFSPIENLMLAADYNNEDVSDNNARNYLNLGGQYVAKLTADFGITARTGFVYVEGGSKLTYGFGIAYTTAAVDFMIDYAYYPENAEVFDNSHRIGISIAGGF